MRPKQNSAMLFFFQVLKYGVFSLAFLLFSGCQKDDEEAIAPEVTVTFADVIATGGVPEEVEGQEEVTEETETEETRSDGTVWKCETRKVSLVQSTSEFPLFNPNASVIYPGSLLKGNTLSSASPEVVPVKRAGGTISIDIVDGSLQPAFTVDEVKKSSIATALNQIIGESSGVVPANFHFTSSQVYSTEHLAVSLGLDVQNQFASIGSQLSFRQDKEYNRFLVELNQSYYTMSFDLPTSPGELFAPEVTPEDLAKYVGPGNPATFISDVTYGRIYYMMIESSSSDLEIQAAIDASFSTAVTGVSVNLETEYLKSLSDMQIKVVALGGDAQTTLLTIGETKLNELVALLGESTDIRTAAPISYVVRSAFDPSKVVGVKLATEYEVKNCEPLAVELPNPILWFDAADLMPTTTDPCTDCLEYNGRYRYYGPNDSFALEYAGEENGTAVRRWRDLSGNGYHASAVANEPNSRPIYRENAFDNGQPAVEFIYGVHYEENFNRLTFSGVGFVDTDYTIFAVIAHPPTIKLEWKDAQGNWAIRRTEDNRYGYFLSGTGSGQFRRLIIGPQNKSLFRLSHGLYSLAAENVIEPSAEFRVFAFRFSKETGMSIYVNGELVASDPTKKEPLQGYDGAFLSAGTFGLSGFSRIAIGEVKVFGVAATELEVKAVTANLLKKYGL